jgi:hypothetical protein
MNFTFSGRCVGDDRLDLVELLADLALVDFHIITVLEIHPELCGGARALPRRSAVSAVTRPKSVAADMHQPNEDAAKAPT